MINFSTSRIRWAFAQLAVVLSLGGVLLAQAGRPAFVFGDNALVRLRADRIDELVAAWPRTAIGKLMQDPVLVEFAERVRERNVRGAERWREVRRVAATLDLELDPWQIVNLFGGDSGMLRQPPLSEWRRFETAMILREDRGIESATTISCRPQFDGRWAQEFEADAAFFRAAPWYLEVPAAKIDGVPSYVFSPPELGDEFAQRRLADQQRWMIHLPGTFVSGGGRPENFGRVDLGGVPAAAHPGVGYRINSRSYAEMFRSMGMVDVTALGIDALGHLDWQLRFEGTEILEEIVLQVAPEREWSGLLKVFASASAPLPSQAMPRGAIMQARAAFDWPAALAVARELLGAEFTLPEELLKPLTQAFDGGVAVGLAAPAPGSLVPRIYVTFGLADIAAFKRLIAALAEHDLPLERVRWGEVEAHVLDLPGLPAGIRPALSVVDGRVHVAESARSLRAFLKLQGQGVVAMEVGKAVQPQGDGELVERFDLRFDPAQLYRSYYTHWLPLLAVTMGAAGRDLSRDSMPDVDVVEEFASPMHAVLRRDGDRLVLRHQAPLGGPLLTAYLLFAPMTLGQSATDGATMTLAAAVARYRLGLIGDAFEAFADKHGRRPADLVELFVDQGLPLDALLVPGDEHAEVITLPGGRRVRSSFRYFRDPAKVSSQGVEDAGRAILIEIVPVSYERLCLASDFEILSLYGDSREWSIERFGR